MSLTAQRFHAAINNGMSPVAIRYWAMLLIEGEYK